MDAKHKQNPMSMKVLLLMLASSLAQLACESEQRVLLVGREFCTTHPKPDHVLNERIEFTSDTMLRYKFANDDLVFETSGVYHIGRDSNEMDVLTLRLLNLDALDTIDFRITRVYRINGSADTLNPYGMSRSGALTPCTY